MSEPLIETEIGRMQNGEYHLRGASVSSLMDSADIPTAIWLTWMGVYPTEPQKRILSACFIASVDHGMAPPSAHVARRVASCGKPLADAVAAGLLTLGPRHGNAAGAASEWMRIAVSEGARPEEFAEKALSDKRRLPGIGHPEYDIDPRTTAFDRIAHDAIESCPHLEFGLAVARAMTEKKGKPLPLNVDGAIGALIADLGAPSELADAIFLCARTVGLVAHAREEAAGSASYRRG